MFRIRLVFKGPRLRALFMRMSIGRCIRCFAPSQLQYLFALNIRCARAACPLSYHRLFFAIRRIIPFEGPLAGCCNGIIISFGEQKSHGTPDYVDGLSSGSCLRQSKNRKRQHRSNLFVSETWKFWKSSQLRKRNWLYLISDNLLRAICD